MYKAGSPASGAEGGGQERENSSGWDLTATSLFYFFLPPLSLRARWMMAPLAML